MKSTEIKEALHLRGLTYSIVAEASDTKESHISAIINLHNKSKRVAGIIAKAIELPLEQVFPEYFDFPNRIKEQRNQRQKVVENLRQRLAS